MTSARPSASTKPARALALVVCGACGRMGKTILGLAQQIPGVTIVGALEAPGSPGCGQEVLPGLRVTDQLEPLLAQANVVLDFSTPHGTLVHARYAVLAKKPMVIGTTGFSPHELAWLHRRVAPLPVVMAANMSLGVNILFHVAGAVARALSRYDVAIHEAHHRHKKDAPSGTALTLQLLISQALGRTPGSIPVTSVRAGEIVGEHTVLFAGDGEQLQITHQADSRTPFAAGALTAARWIVGRKPGLYTMRDVLALPV